jgi:lysophospholipase
MKNTITRFKEGRISRLMTSDDIGIRYGVWSGCQSGVRGTVLLLNGRKEYLEKYHETICDLNDRGFTVISFDWRGQGLSDRLLPDRNKGYVTNYDGYLQDLQDVVEQVVLPNVTVPAIILAHSMGGHIALRFLHDHPSVVTCAVLTAPLIDIFPTPFPGWTLASLTRLAVKTGFASLTVPGSKHRSPHQQKFDGNPLTSDSRRFAFEQQAIADNPDLSIGKPTFGWVSATLASIKILNQPGYAERLTTPVMMFSAEKDRIVSNAAQHRICSKISDCRLEILEGALHEILMESDAIRNKFWQAFDGFVQDCSHRNIPLPSI